MLGRFLEVALVADDTGTSWSGLQQLGFAGATSGDILKHAYGVAACEGIAIGLHATGDEPFSLTFVHPDVAALDRELIARFIDVESTRLGSDVFNELALREPGGLLLRVIAARTFSPPPELPERTALGRFLTVSLPCPDLAEAQGFWERLDLHVQSRNDPWDSITVGDLPIAYHDSGSFREPALLFDGEAAWNNDALRAAGLTIARPLPALRSREHRVLRSAEGLAMILLGRAGS
jgi:hypothetical protein